MASGSIHDKILSQHKPTTDAFFCEILRISTLLRNLMAYSQKHFNIMSSLIENLKSGHTSAAETLALLKSLLIHDVRLLPGVQRRSQIIKKWTTISTQKILCSAQIKVGSEIALS